MAYYVIKALYNKLGREEETDKYLDLVALSLIADVVPLVDESRYLLKKGLPYLYNSQRIGMIALLEQIGKPIETTEDVALMKQTVGETMQVKASGGIRDYETAIKMIEAGATRLGTSSGISIVG
jgi:hypothetical protein